jgi:hypothetical protein
MTTNKKNQWFIMDSMTQIKSQALTDDQLQTTIMRIHEKEYDRYFVWTEIWQNWQSVRLFIQNDDKNILKKDTSYISSQLENTITKSVTYVRTDIDATNASYRNNHKDSSMDQINLDQIKSPENIDFKKLNSKDAYKNRSARHDLKIELVLISKMGKSFRSYSKNISMSGSLLEDNVPFDYYGETFDVVVVNRYAKDPLNSRVQVKGITVGDGVSRRIEFQAYSESTKTKLVFLLTEYLENQKNVAKKAG